MWVMRHFAEVTTMLMSYMRCIFVTETAHNRIYNCRGFVREDQVGNIS